MEAQREEMYIHVTHSRAVQQRLTQHCKAFELQFKRTMGKKTDAASKDSGGSEEQGRRNIPSENM